MLTRLKRLLWRNGTVLAVPPTPLDEHGVTEHRTVSTLLSLSGVTWEHDTEAVRRIEEEVRAHLYADTLRPGGGE